MPLLPILAAGCFVSSMAMRLIDPLVPEISRDLMADPATVAMLATAYALPYALGQPILGALGDALGKAKIIKVALAVLTVCLAVTIIAPTLQILFVARILGGAAGGGVIPLAFALIGDRVAFNERQLALSRVLAAIIGGQVTGSLGSGIVGAYFGWRASMAFGTILTLAAFLLTVVYLGARADAAREPVRLTTMTGGFRQVFRNPLAVVCFAAVFAEGIIIFGLLPYVALLLESRGAGGLREAGFVLAGFAVGGFMYTAFVGLLLGRLGLYNLIRAGGLVCAIGIAGLTAHVTWPIEMALFAVVGVGFYMIHNSLQTQATELAPSNRGSAVAAHAFFFFLGQAAGPVIYGLGLAHAGASPTLIVMSLAMALTGMLTAAGLIARRPAEAAP